MSDSSDLPSSGKPRNGGAKTQGTIMPEAGNGNGGGVGGGGGFLHWLSHLMRGGGDTDLKESIE